MNNDDEKRIQHVGEAPGRRSMMPLNEFGWMGLLSWWPSSLLGQKEVYTP